MGPQRRGSGQADVGARLLVECTRSASRRRESPQVLAAHVPSDAWPALCRLADRHRVGPLVVAALGAALPPEAADLRLQQQRALRARMRCLADLRAAVDALGDLPWLVVKGPALADTVWQEAVRRPSLDLDALVDPRDLATALARLEASGARLATQDWGALRRSGSGEVLLRLPHGTSMDLHWSLFNDPDARSAYGLDAALLLTRARDLHAAGLRLRTAGAVDTLLHVAAHTALSDPNRLVWLKDLDGLVTVEEPHWAGVLVEARRANLSLLVAAQLDRTRHVLGTPVPSDVLAELYGGSAWSRVLRAWARSPYDPSRQWSSGRQLLLATRSDGLASWAQAARLARRNTRRGLTQGVWPWTPEDRRRSTRPVLDRPAAPGERERFLAQTAQP